MNSPVEQLKEKIELFRKNLDDYKSKNYDEYNTRADFIDSLFSAFEWDMSNEQGVIEQFREVIREDKVEIEGRKKSPDYSFRIGQQVIFYVEAKKPSVDIKNNPEPAYQLRRYAYTQGLKLSILTDFEEIAVYDTRIKPESKDSAGIARVFYCTYDELFEKSKVEDYETNFDFLLQTFGKQAVLTGSFNKYAGKSKNKKGTESVDKGFLNLLNTWRENLAVNIALKNEELDEYNLNIAVQKIIDRLLFLRISEDRLIEKPNHLLEISSGEKIYSELLKIFDEADKKYNSNLFVSEEWLKNIILDDKALKTIIEEMYYPKCPYEFSVLPLEILGQSYEQFLGKTIKYIRKTKYGHKVEIEEKPEVRKAGGVYYTPQYIVNYIVENTVGVKIKGKKPEDIEKIKIVDPACGSGSFLIGAYNYFLKYHLEFYLKNDTQKKKALKEGVIYQLSEKRYKLSTAIKSRILVNNIYGVDIDQQAVEVTKLSLLLKVLEDENLEYKEQLFKADAYHLLPNLSENIKCGNSLIGGDFYEDKNLELFNNEDMRKVNVFNWEKKFSGIIKNGGFDCVIGNPPYVDIKSLPESDVRYIFSKFKYSNNRVNLFAAFIEKICVLVNNSFQFSMIVPTSLLTQESYLKLREYITKNYSINKLVRLPNESFGNAAGDVKVDTIIFVFSEKCHSKNKIEIIGYSGYDRISKIELSTAHIHGFINQGNIETSKEYIWSINTTEIDNNILQKCENNSIPLIDCVEFSLGLTPYDKYKGHSQEQIKNKVFHSDHKEKDTFKKLLAGNDVSRYHVKWNGEQWINYGDWLGASREQKFFTQKRILVKQIIDWSAKRIWASITDDEMYNTQNAFNLLKKNNFELEFILGILNSKIMTFYHRKKYLDEFKMRFQKILIKDSKQFPIINIDNGQMKIYNKIISLVLQELVLAPCNL